MIARCVCHRDVVVERVVAAGLEIRHQGLQVGPAVHRERELKSERFGTCAKSILIPAAGRAKVWFVLIPRSYRDLSASLAFIRSYRDFSASFALIAFILVCGNRGRVTRPEHLSLFTTLPPIVVDLPRRPGSATSTMARCRRASSARVRRSRAHTGDRKFGICPRSSGCGQHEESRDRNHHLRGDRCGRAGCGTRAHWLHKCGSPPQGCVARSSIAPSALLRGGRTGCRSAGCCTPRRCR